jgi:hypothetical protein
MSFLAFFQASQQLPTDLVKAVWKLAQEPPTFEEWMVSINTILTNTYELEVSDLPDQPFIDYHEEGLEPQAVIDIMLDDNFIFL